MHVSLIRVLYLVRECLKNSHLRVMRLQVTADWKTSVKVPDDVLSTDFDPVTCSAAYVPSSKLLLQR
jgi:hypothetical protein